MNRDTLDRRMRGAKGYTTRDRALLRQRISELGETEHIEIHKILQRHDVNQTVNRNGVFVDLTLLSNDVIDEISKFVAYCINNNIQLNEYDKRLNECKMRQEYTTIVQNQPSYEVAIARGDGQEQEPEPERTPLAPSPAPAAPPSQSHPRAWINLDKRTDGAKYMQARKKFAKRRVDVATTTGSCECIEELRPEPYLCHRPDPDPGRITPPRSP